MVLWQGLETDFSNRHTVLAQNGTAENSSQSYKSAASSCNKKEKRHNFQFISIRPNQWVIVAALPLSLCVCVCFLGGVSVYEYVCRFVQKTPINGLPRQVFRFDHKKKKKKKTENSRNTNSNHMNTFVLYFPLIIKWMRP